MQKENQGNEAGPIKPSEEYFRQLNTPTKFSRYLALGLFVALPFLGFWLGKQYAEAPEVQVINLIDKPARTEESNPLPKDPVINDITNNANNSGISTTTSPNSDIINTNMTDNNENGDLSKDVESSPNLDTTENDPVQFSLESLHALWGGYNVSISVKGSVSVSYKDNKGGPLETASGQATLEEMTSLANLFLQNKFSSIEDVPIKGQPDESTAVITERTQDGEEITVSQSFNEQTADFREIHNLLIKIADRVRAEV